MTKQELARTFDHTILKPETTLSDINRLCDEALTYEFAAVCVNPIWVPRCAKRVAGSSVRVATVSGFPLGANCTQCKVDEAKRGIDDGAHEIDMVISVGQLIAGETNAVRDDIAAVADAVHAASSGHSLKVILETAALTEAQIVAGCRCVAEAQADYVKTSTGLHPAGGATVEAVRLLHRSAAPIKVKAAGGIRDLATALAMIDAGAARLGCSASVGILQELG
jgi:deoxyribose-phosphate aldolase